MKELTNSHQLTQIFTTICDINGRNECENLRCAKKRVPMHCARTAIGREVLILSSFFFSSAIRIVFANRIDYNGSGNSISARISVT